MLVFHVLCLFYKSISCLYFVLKIFKFQLVLKQKHKRLHLENNGNQTAVKQIITVIINDSREFPALATDCVSSFLWLDWLIALSATVMIGWISRPCNWLRFFISLTWLVNCAIYRCYDWLNFPSLHLIAVMIGSEIKLGVFDSYPTGYQH